MESFMIEYWHWLAAGLLLMAAEMLIPGFYLLFFGAAALVTGALAWALPLPPLWQYSAFALLSIIAVIVGRRWYSPEESSEDGSLNRRGQQLVGRKVVLTEAIVNGRGKVNIDDTQWTVNGDDQAAGTSVIITGSTGSELKVKADR